MKPILAFFLTFLVTLLAYAEADLPKQGHKTIVILLDSSESVKDKRQNYFDAFKKITSQIHVGDRLFLWKITELSEMEPKPLMDEEFPLPPPSANEFYRKAATAKAEKDTKEKLKAIEKRVQSFLNSNDPFSKKTAILGSLQVAERVFKKDQKDRAILVIMSDMIEDASEYNFEKERLTEKRISNIIAAEKSKKRIPDLKGIRVYVTGAKAASRDKFHEIRDFWLRYFKECGANLPKENYGSALLTFNE